MKIHKAIMSKTRTNFYFTKNKRNCLMIEYDSSMDFGKFSTSGTYINKLEIHYNNGWVKKDLIEISINEVPESVVDILTYLK